MAAAKEPEEQDKAMGGGSGVGPVVDPTKNVLDLVKAESKYQDARRDNDFRYFDAITKAETRRLDDLAALRQQYDSQISENLRVQVKTTSELISTQLDKVTTSLSSQISALAATTSTQVESIQRTLALRIGELERYRWEAGGKTSVTDPATADALSKMAVAISGLSRVEAKTEGRGIGSGQVVAWVFAGIGGIAGLVGIVAALGGFR